MPDRGYLKATSYWVLTVLVLAFGVLSLPSVGMFFVLLGTTLVVVGPWRDKRAIFWPAVIGVLGFITGFVLVAPLGCTATARVVDRRSEQVSESHTICSNLLGIDYSGDGLYHPPLGPAVAAGLIVGVTGALTGLVFATRAPSDV